jgi:hypothetical protein
MRRSEINGLCLGWSCKWSGVFNRSRTRGKVSMGRHPQPEQMDKQRPSFDHHQQKHTDSWTAFHDWKEGQTQVDILSTSGCQVSIQRTDRHMGIHSQITPYLNLSSKVFLSNKWPEYSPLWLCPSATKRALKVDPRRPRVTTMPLDVPKLYKHCCLLWTSFPNWPAVTASPYTPTPPEETHSAGLRTAAELLAIKDNSQS